MEILAWDVIDLGPVSSVEACADRLCAALEARFGPNSGSLNPEHRHPTPTHGDAGENVGEKANVLEEVAALADVVLIERQPKARSIIMVAVQMLLCGYFALAKQQGRVGDVRFVSASKKLELVPPNAISTTLPREPRLAPKGYRAGRQARDAEARKRYAANKKFAVDAARAYLEHELQDFANLALLDQYPKKDDLCDALLQAIWYVERTRSPRCS
jgi:hypothetical protein